MGDLSCLGDGIFLYEDREGYFTLKVLYCKQQDNGVYVCSASNTAGQTLSAVHLIVKGKSNLTWDTINASDLINIYLNLA